MSVTTVCPMPSPAQRRLEAIIDYCSNRGNGTPGERLDGEPYRAVDADHILAIAHEIVPVRRRRPRSR
jgi:hypothetical protein